VLPANAVGIDGSDNSAVLQLGQVDAAVDSAFFSQYPDGRFYVNASVVNNGSAAADKFIVKILRDSLDGEVIAERVYGNVLSNERLWIREEITDVEFENGIASFFVTAEAEDDVNLMNNFALAVAEEIVERTGAVVSGVIRSFDPKKPTTIRLLQNGEEIYETTIEAETSGFGRHDQPFAISGISAGSYTLEITKPQHTLFRVTNVVVWDDEDYDFTEHSNDRLKIMTLRAGDIDDDGVINAGDLSILLMQGNFNHPVSGGSFRADLYGDGVINAGDLGILLLNLNRGEVVINAEE
jgi:hypothetical protein